MPGDIDARAIYSGERLTVWASEGVEGRSRDFGAAISPVEGMAEEEADFWDHEGTGNNEGTEEVVDSIGLQGED